ncbi:ribosomal protein L10 [Chloroherpeton thalassium ATCC 35110]|uniref:Large ribosomal subunit protein uL10 n=1 Tax=Chloroherpeton thalassium (strain ATCC 35110 / GB-78) TaxID=517418 RepID=RL10_CHLT3|nr:50S ribosomal protein L10 [Chloroherpeton thalassium]B3QYL2.1 RecName: Full=Large ribosomal subunit protein uL10; AltName: Full=50S ribosomal protein L10 [Chloroherpeton thalassium ATCC 35110]ACF13640.1 ribosomal protein L10 [Chloroherpeton thalassium ATCC 35110]
MNREEKSEIIQSVAEKLSKAQGVYLTEFSGLTVSEISDLRKQFREKDIEYKVVKNTLIKKALAHTKISDKLADGLKNTTAVAFGYDDPIAPAKIIKKYSDGNEKLKFKMASVDGTIFEAGQLDQLSNMLSKTENIGRIAGTINNVISGVPGTVNAVMRNLVSALEQIAKQKAA